jgi:glycosyltransferase involved in cell wall biosynthesis
MKILLVHNFYGSSAPSGENTAFEAERELLKAHGHDVIEFTRRSDEIRAMGMTGNIIGAMSALWNPFVQRALRKIIGDEKPDIMHVHNFFPLISPSAFYAACGSNTATVFTLHNYRIFCAAGIPMRDGTVCTECMDRGSVFPALKYGCYRGSRFATLPLAAMIALHRRLGTWPKHVDAFITLTDFQRRTVTWSGLPDDRLHVKPHFYADAPVPLAVGQRENKVVFIGRLSREKGVDLLLEAWKLIGNDAPRLEIIGSGPGMERMIASVKGAPNESSITFTGQLPFEETQKRLACASALVLPTLCFEGFPMVIREAFALGVPVIASSIGSVPDIIKEGVNGILFHPGKVNELAAAIKTLFGDRGMLCDMSRAARAEFDSKFTAEVNIRLLTDIYRAAILNRQKRMV